MFIYVLINIYIGIYVVGGYGGIWSPWSALGHSGPYGLRPEVAGPFKPQKLFGGISAKSRKVEKCMSGARREK